MSSTFARVLVALPLALVVSGCSSSTVDREWLDEYGVLGPFEPAVEAGKAEVERVGTLTGALVIARPDPVIQRLFSDDIPVGTAFDR